MLIGWNLKRKQNQSLAVLFFPVYLKVWMGNDHPTKGSSFLLLQRTLQVPYVETFGKFTKSPLKIVLFYYLVLGFLWNISLKYNVVSCQILS